MDTVHKLNTQRTFRCSECLLDVLCTFNERPVSRGDTIYYLTRGFLLHQIYKWSISFTFTHSNKKLSLRLKLVRIILETSNLARKYTHICSFRKYTFNTKVLLILLNFFLQKISVFWSKQHLCSKQWCESCVRDFLVLFSVFVR